MHFRLSSLKCNSLKSGSATYLLQFRSISIGFQITLWVGIEKCTPTDNEVDSPREEKSWVYSPSGFDAKEDDQESCGRENQEEAEDGEAVASDFYETRGVTVAVDGEESCSLVKPWSTRKLSKLRW